MLQSIVGNITSDYGGDYRETAFRTMKPSHSAGSIYSLIHNIRGDEPIPMVDGKYRSDERMYGQALGLDYIPKLPESSYKPSTSENPDAKYSSVMEYLNPAEVLKQTDVLNSGFPTEQELKEGFYTQGKTYSGPGSKHNVEFSDDPAFGYNKTAARANTFSEKDLETYNDFFHPLENFTMGAGQDDKGTYISIYDKYDVASPTLNKYLQPYEIYDRIYYTTDEQGNRIPMKKYGGTMKNYNNIPGAGFGDMFKKLGQQIKTGLTGAVQGATGGIIPATKLLRPELREEYADEMKMGSRFGTALGILAGGGAFSGASAGAAAGAAGMSSVPGANTFNALYGSGINPAMMNPSLAGQASGAGASGFGNLFNMGSNFGTGNTASGMFNMEWLWVVELQI